MDRSIEHAVTSDGKGRIVHITMEAIVEVIIRQLSSRFPKYSFRAGHERVVQGLSTLILIQYVETPKMFETLKENASGVEVFPIRTWEDLESLQNKVVTRFLLLGLDDAK